MAIVRQDFFLDPRNRLTEQERALMTGMVADLLGAMSDEIRAGLPAGWGAANDEDGQQLVRKLNSARLLDHSALIGLLLRRADEERLASAVRARSGRASTFLQALIADPDELVSAAAMALILARGRRRDRLGQPRLELDDLPPRVASPLVHAVAAAIRERIVVNAESAEIDRHLSAAAAALLQRCDATKRLEAVTAALVRALQEQGRLDDALLGAAAEEGDVGFLAEALAERSGIDGDAAWDHVLDGEQGGLVTLLRMAQVSRDFAARLLAGLGDLVGIADLGREITRFETISDDEARAAQQWLRLEPAYRAAREALGRSDG